MNKVISSSQLELSAAIWMTDDGMRLVATYLYSSVGPCDGQPTRGFARECPFAQATGKRTIPVEFAGLKIFKSRLRQS